MIPRVSPLVGEQNKWGYSLWEGKPVSTWIPGTERQGPHWPDQGISEQNIPRDEVQVQPGVQTTMQYYSDKTGPRMRPSQSMC